MPCLLDCDGCLADFVSGALGRHGRLRDGHDSVRTWKFYEAWDITAAQFWKRCRGRSFWYNLQPYPWAEQLLRACGPDVTVVTAPPTSDDPDFVDDPECAGAKIDWLRKHFGIRMVDVMIGTKKHLMANPQTLLIDDSVANISAFHNAGGRACLFPQPWNNGAGDYQKVLEIIDAFRTTGA